MEKQGRLAEIIYHSEDTYYTVAAVEDDQAMERFIVVGNMADVNEGLSFTFSGDWKTHPVYGEQFAFTQYKEELPTTDEGLVDFLSSGIFKGVGVKTAERIVRAFGGETLRVIGENPERLIEVPGIGENKAKSIDDDFKAHREYATVALFFRQYGISSGNAMKLYKAYGAHSVELIKANPYRIVDEIPGTGFLTADKIAVKFGFKKDSEFRIESGIKYALWKSVNEGHTFFPHKQFCEYVAEFLDVSAADISDLLIRMTIEGSLHIEELEKRKVVYLYRYFNAENFVCKQLMALNDAEPKQVDSRIDELIRITEIETGIELSGGQIEAVMAAVINGVCVITGGPGTGKTTIINTIISIFENNGMKVAIAAPTGRAAKRMTETTGRYASTIHRLLEYYYSEDKNEMNFGKNSENPLDHDVVIVDETSMIDILLMEGLLKAMSAGTRLVIVGDADQLPSVGAGNVLRDIISSEVIHSVKLTEIFRQAKESMIVVNAHRINRGEEAFLNERDKDFFMIRKNSEQAILETIKDLCFRRLPSYYSQVDPVKDIQVLSPVRKGVIGTINLNKELQKVLNPSSAARREKVLRERVFREGDKVMQIKNNYQIEWKRTDDFSEGSGIFNGDVGYIESIDNEFNIINVIFDDSKRVQYNANQLDELEPAYAVTVHKSQGSEFPIVVMPISWFPSMLSTRNLLYTAITRGKTVVVLVGDELRLNGMIKNNKIEQRYSGLGIKLRRFLAVEF